ncbi:hypothetical protein LX32DRAFT_634615 [Colletotrichum zoysiae]|uniref:Uncharacterized protein n=1 Tax=Colletotrichum zoysiae TaxID=1216348 RepID=A0AAD9HTT7_9PEZI|nr:hypothetical protein LX32DRAFT_634615 [Colletotrichum zoysiae]
MASSPLPLGTQTSAIPRYSTTLMLTFLGILFQVIRPIPLVWLGRLVALPGQCTLHSRKGQFE